MWHGVLFYIQGWSSSLRSFVWRVDIRSPYTLDYPTDYLRSRLLRKSWRFGLSNICWQNIFMCWSVSSRVKTRITKERNLQYVAVMNLRPRNVSTKWSLFNISFGQVTRFSILVGCLNCFLLHRFFSFLYWPSWPGKPCTFFGFLNVFVWIPNYLVKQIGFKT